LLRQTDLPHIAFNIGTFYPAFFEKIMLDYPNQQAYKSALSARRGAEKKVPTPQKTAKIALDRNHFFE